MAQEQKNQSQVKTEHHKSIKRIIWGVLILIILGVIGFAIQQSWMMRIHVQRIQTQLLQVNQTINDQAQTIADQSSTLSHLEKVAGSNQVKWKLTEAEYLVRMAILTLNFQNNVPSAVALLKAADHRIQGFSHPAWISARKVLVDDIAALEALPQVDVTGLYLKIQALDNQVDQLPLQVDTGKKQLSGQPSQADIDHQHSPWAQALINSWNSIRQVLVIRHHDQPIRPFLLLNQQKLLTLDLHVIFANAEWALLQGNEKVYVANLKQAQQMIQQYFIHTNAMTTHMLQSLKELQQQPITSQLPDISNALTAVKALENTEDQL